MNVDKCIAHATMYMRIDKNLILCKISEAYEKHSNNIALTDNDRFFLGLRYSEFLSDSDSDEGYLQASIKRDACLRILGIDMMWLMEKCILVCNLH